ncbi:MAG: cytochrome c [Flavobacteriales bacterium]|nr:cytochrome c [Flavobacteriales bacterium]
MNRKNVLFLIVGIFLAWACGSKQQSNSKAIDKLQEATIDGKNIYQRECVLCHGEEGDKGVAGSAHLTQSSLTLEERIYVISNGRGIMQPFKNKLTPGEIEAVARYTQELKR